MTRVLVCGGRDFTDREWLYRVLDNLNLEKTIEVIIHGGAQGADTMAGRWAEILCIPTQVIRADWKRHGRAAGPIRNLEMLDRGRPDLVVAFPGGRGTNHMIRSALKANVPCAALSSKERHIAFERGP